MKGRRKYIYITACLIIVVVGAFIWLLCYWEPVPSRIRPKALHYRPIEFDPKALPKRVRILRTRLPFDPGKCIASAGGKCIQDLDMETYIKGVVAAEEWIFANQAKKSSGGYDEKVLQKIKETWKLQAIAARTYVTYVILADKYNVLETGYHISDNPVDQAYVDGQYGEIGAAVDQTRGMMLVDGQNRLIYAEYSASCGGKGTQDVVRRQVHISCHKDCKKHEFWGSSHYRGMCQWGSLLFAMEGKDLAWLRKHYYPHAQILGTHHNNP